MNALRLGTRGSPLALWQANYIANLLRPVAAPRAVELVLIETHGDRDQASACSITMRGTPCFLGYFAHTRAR